MPAPGAVTQVCALVEYPYGYAASGMALSVTLLAHINPADIVPGLQLRVHWCTDGAFCNSPFDVGLSTAGVTLPSDPEPFIQFVWTSGVQYNTIYRLRVRLESSGGNGPWSSQILVNTATHGFTVCDSGVFSDFDHKDVTAYGTSTSLETSVEKVIDYGVSTSVESTLGKVIAYGVSVIMEFGGHPLPTDNGGSGNGGGGEPSGPPTAPCTPPVSLPPVSVDVGECVVRLPTDTLNYTPPFRLYQKDCEVRMKSWSDDGAYSILRPFGGDSFEGPAKI